MAMSDIEANEIIMADTLRYIARYRRDTLALGTYATPHSSRDNVGVHDGHKANTYRRMPRTAYSNPTAEEGTSPGMVVTLSDGTQHVVPATRSWRAHLPEKHRVARTRRSHTVHASEMEAIGDVE